MAHDVAHFPGCTGTGVVPRICGEGMEVLRELLCCCLAKLDTVLSCVHGVLLCVFFSPSRKRHGNFAQFIGLCRRSKWSIHFTNSPLLALRAMVGSSAARKSSSACSKAFCWRKLRRN